MNINELTGLLKQGYGGRQLTALYTEKIDSIVKEVFYSAYSDSAKQPGICLIAIGGYGRGELAPYSDVDIMLFAMDRSISEEAEQLLYGLWNTNLNISHSFRTPSDCINEAKKDIRTRTSLLEHRHIAGDDGLYNYFKESVYPEIAFRNHRNFASEKLREIESRYKRFGDSVFMLEPNIKEGKGGLRDVHSILWVGAVASRIRSMDELTKILTDYDLYRLRKAYDFLLKTRFCLHILSERKNDTLTFEFHERAAELLNFKASRKFLASERFMRYYYLKASIISNIAAYALDICSIPYVHPREYFFTKKKVTENFVIAKDRIASARSIARDADIIIEAFSVMSKTGKRCSPGLRADIKKNLFRVTKKTRRSPKAVEWFMGIIRGNRIYETLREMHYCGVLGRFIPEFGALSFLVVYEPYHRYTVDEHSLHAIKRIEELRDTRYKNMEHLAGIFRKIRHKEALVLSLLLHDIGKKRITRERRFPDRGLMEPRHEGEGYIEMKKIMERFNLDIELRNRIEFLVKNHTLMSSVAFRRETDDPDVIAQFADEMGDRENLDAIYLVTYADMAAVAPDFWTDWKSYLLREFYENVCRYIEGTAQKGHERIGEMFSLSPKDKKGIERFVSLMPKRYILSTPPERLYADYRLSCEVREKKFGVKVHDISEGIAEITVGAWDRPGLFSRIVGVLSSMEMNICRARVYTGEDGLVIDGLQVSNWKELWWEGLPRVLEEKLKEAITAEHPVIRITGNVYPELPPPELPERFAPFVELDNETSAEYSILEFFAQDRIGLLYDATSIIHEKGIDIISARINTESGLAHDLFSIRKNGSRINGADVAELLISLWEKLR